MLLKQMARLNKETELSRAHFNYQETESHYNITTKSNPQKNQETLSKLLAQRSKIVENINKIEKMTRDIQKIAKQEIIARCGGLFESVIDF